MPLLLYHFPGCTFSNCKVIKVIHFLVFWIISIMLHVQFRLYWYIDRQINRCYYCQKDKLCDQNLVMSTYISMDSFVLFIWTIVLSKDGICDHLWNHNITTSFTSMVHIVRTEKKCKEVQGPSSVNPLELVPYLPHNILVHGPSRRMKSFIFIPRICIYIYIYSIYLK